MALISLLIRGWRIEATLMYVATLGLFVTNPNTEVFVGTNVPNLPPPFQWLRLPSPPVPYLWLHLVALGVLVSPLTRNLRDSFIFGARRDLAKAVLVVAFTGPMIEHVTGEILFASVIGAGALRFLASHLLGLSTRTRDHRTRRSA